MTPAMMYYVKLYIPLYIQLVHFFFSNQIQNKLKYNDNTWNSPVSSCLNAFYCWWRQNVKKLVKLEPT